MYPDLNMQESIKKVEAARAENVKLDPRRMTAEERADLLNDIQTMLSEKGYPLYVGGYNDKGKMFEVILCVEREEE